MCLSLCPLPSVLLVGTTEKSLLVFALLPPIRYLYTLYIKNSKTINNPEIFHLNKNTSKVFKVLQIHFIRCPFPSLHSPSNILLQQLC